MFNNEFDENYNPTVFEQEEVYYEVSDDGTYALKNNRTDSSRALR